MSHRERAHSQDESPTHPHAGAKVKPEQCFDKMQLPKKKEYVQSPFFSKGGRTCIGPDLVTIDLTKVMAAVLVSRYEVELLQYDLPTFERFSMSPQDCHVRLRNKVRLEQNWHFDVTIMLGIMTSRIYLPSSQIGI